MKSYRFEIWECLHDICSNGMKFHLCQNDRYEIHTALNFKRTCALNATSNESVLIHFVSGKLCSHENLMPV